MECIFIFPKRFVHVSCFQFTGRHTPTNYIPYNLLAGIHLQTISPTIYWQAYTYKLYPLQFTGRHTPTNYIPYNLLAGIHLQTISPTFYVA